MPTDAAVSSRARSYRRLFRYAAAYRRGWLIVAGTTLAATGLTLLQPWPLQVLVDHVLGGVPLSGVLGAIAAAWPAAGSREGLLAGVVAAGLAIAIASSAVEYVAALQWTQVGRRMVYDLSRDLFARVQRRSLAAHTRHAVGDSMGRVAVDAWCLHTIVDALLFAPSHALVTTLVLVVVMVQVDAGLTLLALAVAPVMAAAAWAFKRPIREAAHARREIESRIQAHVHQTLSGVSVVQAFAREDDEERRFTDLAAGAIRAHQRTAFVGSLYGLGSGLVTTFGTAVVMWAAAMRVLDGRLTIGTTLVFLAYLATLQWQLSAFAAMFTAFQGAGASIDRVLDVLAGDDALPELAGAPALPAVRGEVCFEHVDFSHVPGQPVLHDVDFRVGAGDAVAIVGATGAGKSSLVALLPRFADPDRGHVRIDGHDLREVSLVSLRDQIAVVLQEPFLFPDLGRREHRARPAPRHAFRNRSGRPGRQRARVHRGLAPGLRHGGRGAGHDPVGRRAPANRHRPRLAQGCPDPDPRRADQRARRRDGTGHRRGPGAPDARPHHLHRRPPAVDDPARHDHCRARRRTGRRAGQPRDAARPRRALHAALHPAVRRAVGGGGLIVTTHAAAAAAPHVDTGAVRLLRWLTRYALRRWGGLLAVLATMVGKIGLDLLKPWPLKVLVDSGLGQQALSPALVAVAGLLPGSGTREGVIGWSVVATVALFVAAWALGVATAYANIGFGQRMVYDLASDLYSHLQRLSLRFHSRQSVGDSIRRVTTDCGCVSVIVKDAVLPFAAALISFVAMFVVMWRLEPTLTLVSMIVAPWLLLVLRRYMQPMLERSYEQQEAEARIWDVMERTLSALPVVQAFGQEPARDRAFARTTDDVVRAAVASTIVGLKFKVLIGLGTACGTAAIVWLGAQSVLDGQLTAGGILVFLAYLAALYGPLETLMYAPSTTQGAAGSARRVLEILETRREVDDRPGARRVRLSGHVRFEDVTFGYDADRPILHEVSLEVRPGETVAIIGHTGAGKSTLAGLVPRFNDPWSGRVTVDGVDLRDIELKSLRSQVAVVLQEPFLLPMSIADNIAYGRPHASRAEIEAAARAANAHGFIGRLPKGYDTVLAERGATLSGGERQRLSVARAILKDAPVLILDEPTSAIDSLTEASLLEALERLMQGRATIVIAHRMSTIAGADRIVVLDHGRVVEQGTPAELHALGGVYARYQAMQAAPGVLRAAG